jgi:hypothetical protein
LLRNPQPAIFNPLDFNIQYSIFNIQLIQPHMQQREQFICINRFGQIVIRASFQAFLPVIPHRFGR